MRLLVFLVMLGLPMAASAQIAGGPHDLRGTIPGLTETCVVCHAPHNNQNERGDLLWNRSLPTTVYETYASHPLDGGVPEGFMHAAPQPSGSDLRCLGCHDGTIALDSFGQRTPVGPVMGDVAPMADLGHNLSNDHPIGVSQTADPAMNPNPLKDDGTPISLRGGAIGCFSCHDIHGPQVANLLVKDNTGSNLCVECHWTK